MSNEENLFNNCSEDIFQCCSESNEVRLRRSQRILERGLKTPTCSENILEEFSSQNYSQLLLPLSRASRQKLKNSNPKRGDHVEDTEIKDNDDTLDFTHILNTENPYLYSSQLKESEKSTIAIEIKNEQSKENSIDLNEVKIKDKKRLKGRRYRGRKPMKPISNQDLKEPSNKPLLTKVLENSQSDNTVVQYENDVKKNIFSKSLTTKKSISIPINVDQVLPLLNTNDVNNKREKHSNTTTVEEDNSLGVSQGRILPLIEENIKREITSIEKMDLSIYESQVVKKNPPRRGQKVPLNQTTKKLPRQRRNRQSKKFTSNSRKRDQKSSENFNSNKRPRKNELKPNTSGLTYDKEKSIIKDYIPPKVIRYNNTYPRAQTPNVFQYAFPISERSLLPAIYPAHFTQQIIQEPPGRLTPLACLTPENSQVLKQPTLSIADTPSTPLSVGSLQEFFEIDDLFNILNTEKTIYNLTELHVRALAISLNLNVDNLFTLMDKIVEMEVNFLREKCEIQKPIVSARLFESNHMERND